MLRETEELVTVIVPAFNAERTLAETLAAASGQTYRNLEIIVIDDGSSDTTFEVASRHAECDSRMVIMSHPCRGNRGVASARNLGLTAARGRFIAFLDADDLWHPEHIELLMACALEKKCDMVFARYRKIDNRGFVLGDGHDASIFGRAMCRMTHLNYVGNGSALLVSQTAALATGGYNESLREAGLEGCEDYLFQLDLCANGATIATAPYLVGYRQGENRMSSNFDRMTASLELTLKLFLKRHSGLVETRRAARWHLARARRHLAVWLLRKGRWWAAYSSLTSALIADPAGTSAFLWRHVVLRPSSRTADDNVARTAFLDCDPGRRMADVVIPSDWLTRIETRRSQWLENADRSVFPSRPSDE